MTVEPIAFVVVTPGNDIDTFNESLTAQRVTELLGGDFLILEQPPGLRVYVFAREDGHKVGLLPNWIATQLMRQVLKPDVFLVGNVLITGEADSKGEPTTLPDAAMVALKEIRASRTT